MAILTGGKNRVLTLIDNDLYRGGLGTKSTDATSSDTGLLGSYDLIEACDAAGGWIKSGVAGTEILNDTEGYDIGGYSVGGTACLNLPANVGTNLWLKNIGGSDYTGKHVYCGFFIADKTELATGGSCVRVYLHSTVLGNYWNFSRDSLYNGWQYLECDVDNEDGVIGTGGTMTNVQAIELSVQADEIVGGSDMRMDDWHYLTPNSIGIMHSWETPTTSSANKVLKVSYNVGGTIANYYEHAETGLSLNSGNVMLNRNAFEIARKDRGEEWQNTFLLYID